MKIEDIKLCISDAIEEWAEGIVTSLTQGNPRMAVMGYYMKNGIRNYLHREAAPLMKMVDDTALFIADTNGEVNLDKVFADGISVLKEMEELPYRVAGMHGTIGKGKIRIELPLIASLFFGDDRMLTITPEDLMCLRKRIG